MDKILVILAQIEAEPGKTDLVKSELEKLVAPTQKEKGCIKYDLHQDNDNPSFFVFYEHWANRDLWQNHMNTAHIKSYMKATENAVKNFTVNELSL